MCHIHLVNAIQKLLLYELILAMNSVYQKWICVYQDCGNKGFMFTIKEVWDRVAAQRINFLTSTVANGRRFPL